MLSSSEISLSMARILAFVSSLRWASDTWSRYLAISISMLSEMFSYFSMRLKVALNRFSSFSVSSSRTMPNMRCMRSAKASISLCASSTESSGVFMMPEVMKCNLKSSSSAWSLGLMAQHTKRSRYCMNHICRKVLVMLKAVWKAARTTQAFIRLPSYPGSPGAMERSKPTREQTALMKG